MDPLTVSAQFSAYVWYSHGKPDTPNVRARANRFAQENWHAFLPSAHEGLGRLLLRLAHDKEELPRQEKRSSQGVESPHEAACVAC